MQDWLPLLALLGPASLAVTITQVFANRRKLSADAVHVIQQAASGMVADLRVDLKRTEQKLERAGRKIEALDRHLQLVVELLREHAPGVAVPPFRWPPLPERQSNGHTS